MPCSIEDRNFFLRKEFLMLFFILSIGSIFAYQDSAFSVFTPTNLSAGEMELSIVHRFYGAVDDDVFGTMFGMNAGANVGLAFRYNIKHRIEIKGAYTRAKKMNELGLSWCPTHSDYPLSLQIDAAYFSFSQVGLSKRRANFVYILSVQNKIYAEKFVLTANLGFDGYYERPINAYALHINQLKDLSFICEYYPVWDRSSASSKLEPYLGKYDVYSFGIKYQTWGHHFKFSLGNGTNFHPATQSLGTDNKSDLYFGFNIHRRF